MEDQTLLSKKVWMIPELTAYGKVVEITTDARCKELAPSDEWWEGIRDAPGACAS
jgi:hypothetical protein